MKKGNRQRKLVFGQPIGLGMGLGWKTFFTANDNTWLFSHLLNLCMCALCQKVLFLIEYSNGGGNYG